MTDTLEGIDFRKTPPIRAMLDDQQCIAIRMYLRFEYKNWNGFDHEYLVAPVAIELGTYDESGQHPDTRNREDNLKWVLQGKVVYRDGEEHPGGYMIPRTFQIDKMRNIRPEVRL